MNTTYIDEMKLTLLPPEEPEEVSEEDIKYFYKTLANILMSENYSCSSH